MTEAQKRRLAAAGWKQTTVKDFLGLSREEEAIIEMKLALAHALRYWREASDLTQAALAKSIGSSQSRVAKAEAGDPSVSFDLLVRALLSVGVKRPKLGHIIATAKAPRTSKRAVAAELRA